MMAFQPFSTMRIEGNYRPEGIDRREWRIVAITAFDASGLPVIVVHKRGSRHLEVIRRADKVIKAVSERHLLSSPLVDKVDANIADAINGLRREVMLSRPDLDLVHNPSSRAVAANPGTVARAGGDASVPGPRKGRGQ